MAAVNWPTIKECNPEHFNQVFFNPGHRSSMESGKVVARKQFTSGRWIFTLGWPALTDADYNTLVTFFNTYQGELFNWPHIKTAAVHECIFMDDKLPEAYPMLGHWQLLGVKIMEIG